MKTSHKAVAAIAAVGGLAIAGVAVAGTASGELETFDAGQFTVAQPAISDPESLHPDEAAGLGPGDTVVQVRVTASYGFEDDLASVDIAGCDSAGGWSHQDEPETFYDMFICPGAEIGTKLTVEIDHWDWDDPVVLNAPLAAATAERLGD